MTDQRTQIAAYFFFAVFLFVLYQITRIFSPFFQAFFWAVVLTFAFYPMHGFFLRLFKGHSALASFVTTLSIVAIVITPSILVLQSMVRHTIQLYHLVVRFVDSGGLENWIAAIQTHSFFQSFQESVSQGGLLSDALRQHASSAMLKSSQFLANTATSRLAYITKNVFLVSLNTMLMVVLIFVLFKDGDRLYQAIYKLVPMDDKDRRALATKISETFAGVIRGQFLTGLIQSVLAGLTFFFLGFPASSLFGLATFMSSLVPVIGASAIWVPASVYLFLTNQVVKGVILVLVGTFVISLSDNLLKPILVSERTRIPVFLLFLGILGGMRAYGLEGAFLAPVFIALLFALLEIYRGRYQ